MIPGWDTAEKSILPTPVRGIAEEEDHVSGSLIEPQIRKASRQGKGCHSNLYALPKSAISNEVDATPVPAATDLQVLADVSRTQLLFMQMLSGIR